MLIPIFNPELLKLACCGYGHWFAVDVLIELWQQMHHRGTDHSLSKICPACGATVTVHWNNETVEFEPRKAE